MLVPYSAFSASDVSGHPRNEEVWAQVTQTKEAVLAHLSSANDGVRTHALKFIHKLVYCFTVAPDVRGQQRRASGGARSHLLI